MTEAQTEAGALTRSGRRSDAAKKVFDPCRMAARQAA